jgi:SET domain-containing protein
VEIRQLFASDLIQSAASGLGGEYRDVIAGFAEDSSLKGQANRKKAPKAAAAKKATRKRNKTTPARRRAQTAGKAAGKAAATEPDPYLLADPPEIERRKSRINGWGVFALQRIPKNKRIIHYGGEKIPSKASTPREERYLSKGHIWCFKLNNRWVIDAAVGGNVARFINHACKPNCYTEIKNGVIWIRAARTIRKGEELTYNYYTEGSAEIPCRCVPGCQGML